MTKKTLFTTDDIIAAGKALEIGRPGRDVEPWLIYKRLGTRGNYERVKSIWEKHVADSKDQPDDAIEADCIPGKFRESLDALFGSFGTGIDALLAQYDAHLSGQFNRQIRILQEDHARELANQREEAEFWRNRALDAERTLAESEENNEKGKGKANPVRTRRTAAKIEPAPPQEAQLGQMSLQV